MSKYDIFLSHKQQNGADLAQSLKLLLTTQRPELKIYLDVDDCNELHSLQSAVEDSMCFLLIITEGVFEREWVRHEIKTALKAKKHIILVLDEVNCKVPSASSLSEDIREVLNIKALPYFREKAFRETSVNEILKKFDEGTGRASPHALRNDEELPVTTSKLTKSAEVIDVPKVEQSVMWPKEMKCNFSDEKFVTTGYSTQKLQFTIAREIITIIHTMTNGSHQEKFKHGGNALNSIVDLPNKSTVDVVVHPHHIVSIRAFSSIWVAAFGVMKVPVVGGMEIKLSDGTVHQVGQKTENSILFEKPGYKISGFYGCSGARLDGLGVFYKEIK